MVVGRGQLAKSFMGLYGRDENVLVFASGVSNSRTLDESEYNREKSLLLQVLHENPEKVIIYFSSAALVSEEFLQQRYYRHKYDMEKIVASHANYLIVRLPQVFSDNDPVTTLIHNLKSKLLSGEVIDVWRDAYRYVIDSNDIPSIVQFFLDNKYRNRVVYIANPYRYSVVEIVHELEMVLQKTARINLTNKTDKYILDLTDMELYINEMQYEKEFGIHYIARKFKQYWLE